MTKCFHFVSGSGLAWLKNKLHSQKYRCPFTLFWKEEGYLQGEQDQYVYSHILYIQRMRLKL